MRKTSLILLGTAAGMALTLVATQSYVALGGTDTSTLATPTNYRLLDVFGDAYDQVRKHYVEKPNDKDLMGTAINGMLSSLEDSYYVDPKTLHTFAALRGPLRVRRDVGIRPSRWSTVSPRSLRQSTILRPPRPASWQATSSPSSTGSRRRG